MPSCVLCIFSCLLYFVSHTPASSHTACTAASISFMLSDIFAQKMKSHRQTVKHLIVLPTMIKSITEPKFTQNGTFAQQHWRLWPGWRYTGAPQTGNNVSCQFSPKSRGPATSEGSPWLFFKAHLPLCPITHHSFWVMKDRHDVKRSHSDVSRWHGFQNGMNKTEIFQQIRCI